MNAVFASATRHAGPATFDPRYGVFDQSARQMEKAEARVADAEYLRYGRLSDAELARKNGFFSALDMRGARIVAIGAREIAVVRRIGDSWSDDRDRANVDAALRRLSD